VPLGTPSLLLSSSWLKERLRLVRATDAVRLCRQGGHEELTRQQSLRHLLGTGRLRVTEARDFAGQAKLFSFPLTNCDDARLFAQLRKLVEAGMLVVVRENEGHATKETLSLAKQRRAVRALEQTRPRGLKFEGRTYRLVADMDLGQVADRDDYTVVSHAEAKRVLDGMAASVSPAQVGPFEEARNQLTNDWRHPLTPDGLVLLKKIQSSQSVPKSEAPMGKPQRRAGGGAAAEAPAIRRHVTVWCLRTLRRRFAQPLDDVRGDLVPIVRRVLPL
jgi:hypothetical protein